MKNLIILFTLINCDIIPCTYGNVKHDLGRYLHEEAAEAKEQIEELWSAIDKLNSSQRCLCFEIVDSEQRLKTEELEIVSSESENLTKPLTRGKENDCSNSNRNETEKVTIILNLHDMDNFQEYLEEQYMQRFEERLLNQIKSVEQRAHTEIRRLSERLIKKFGDFEGTIAKETDEMKNRITAQQKTISENEMKITELEKRLQYMSDLLVQLTEGQKTSSTFTPVQARTCSQGWNKFDDRCYLFLRRKANWFSAGDACRSFDGKLVEPYTRPVVDFVFSLTQGTRVWIGVTDRFEEGTYVWGSSGQKAAFLPWEPGQPNNFLIDQDCVEMIDTQPLLNDKPCFAENAFVCERETTV